eukprot:11162863-Lingulodinium_polyedra.AAC.1
MAPARGLRRRPAHAALGLALGQEVPVGLGTPTRATHEGRPVAGLGTAAMGRPLGATGRQGS